MSVKEKKECKITFDSYGIPQRPLAFWEKAYIVGVCIVWLVVSLIVDRIYPWEGAGIFAGVFAGFAVHYPYYIFYSENADKQFVSDYFTARPWINLDYYFAKYPFLKPYTARYEPKKN